MAEKKVTLEVNEKDAVWVQAQLAKKRHESAFWREVWLRRDEVKAELTRREKKEEARRMREKGKGEA